MAGVKGRSGRRPNEQLFRDRITHALAQIAEKDPRGRTNLEVIVGELLRLAKGGNLQAINTLMERVDGKPKQSVELDMNVAELTDEDLDARIEQHLKASSRG